MSRLRHILAALALLALLHESHAQAPAPAFRHTLDPTHILDLSEPLAVFRQLCCALPPQVSVWPTENYFYWELHHGTQHLKGNLRLASGLRETGQITFSYTRDGTTTPYTTTLSHDHGITLQNPDPFTCILTHAARSITFHLHQLPQTPPTWHPQHPTEHFICRTYDESGLRFHLMFHPPLNTFYWTLEDNTRSTLQPLTPHLHLHSPTGFLFFIDPATPTRQILCAVHHPSLMANTYHDGPFDQLADNYADQANWQHYMQLADPSLRGRIDKWGYLTHTRPLKRVALNAAATYRSAADLPQTIPHTTFAQLLPMLKASPLLK